MPFVRKPPGSPPASKPQDAAVLVALTSANPDERWTAARAAVQTPGGVAALAQVLLTEKDPRVREAMLTSLSRIGTPESARALLPLLRCDQAELRTGALDALRMMPAALLEVLPVLLSDPDDDVRILSCELARALPGDEATTLLCNLLALESQVNLCAAAIEVLAEVGTPAALPFLARCSERFPSAPFLGFAVEIAIQRIKAQSTGPRG